MSNLRKIYKSTLELYFPTSVYAAVGYELDFNSKEESVQLYDGDKLIKTCSYRDMLQYLRIKTPSLPWVK